MSSKHTLNLLPLLHIHLSGMGVSKLLTIANNYYSCLKVKHNTGKSSEQNI